VPHLVIPPYVAGPGGGSNIDRVLGTGLALPGLDGFYQYNGLLMNVRDWIDTFLFRQIDGLDDADVRNSANPNPGEHGETPGNAYYGGRTISINGVIRYMHYPKMLDMRDALRATFANIQDEQQLWIRHPSGDTTLDRVVYCRKQGKLEIPSISSREQTFQITLRASNPRIMSYEMHSVSINTGETIVINNKGNLFAQPRIRFFGNGTLTRTVGDIQQVMQVTSVADYVEVDTSRRYKRIVNAAEANAYDKLTDASDFITIEPGDNTISFTGTSNVMIAWRDSWV
jgi:Phage tail protein